MTVRRVRYIGPDGAVKIGATALRRGRAYLVPDDAVRERPGAFGPAGDDVPVTKTKTEPSETDTRIAWRRRGWEG